MKAQKRIAIITVTIVFLLATTIAAICERAAWDCPECGKKGNIGKFCGGCGHPVPTDDGASSKETGNVTVTVGDTITFGVYSQTSEGKDHTPIEWIVLDIQDEKALLLSKYGLDAKQYKTEILLTNIITTWENSTLRNWLNNYFIRSAFSNEEQSAILVTDVKNGFFQGYKGWRTNGGSNTKDQIFLLSYEEANKYLNVTNDNNNVKSRVSPTDYALTKGASTCSSLKTDEGFAAGWWWLRSPGSKQKHAACVGADGSLGSSGIGTEDGIVRPAFWLNLTLLSTTISTPNPVPAIIPPYDYPPISITPSVALPIENGCWLLNGNIVDELEIQITGGMLYVEASVINEKGETCLRGLKDLSTLEDGEYTLFVYSIPEVAPVSQKFIINRSRVTDID